MLSKSMAPKFPIKDSNINSTVFFHYLCGYFPDCIQVVTTSGFPGGSVVKKICLPVQETQEMPGWSLGQEDPLEGKPVQYSCLENPTDRGAWMATVRGVGHS